MTKQYYEPPEAESLELGPMLDVCNYPGNEKLGDKPGSGFEDEFTN